MKEKEDVITVKDFSKSFSNKKVIKELSFEVKKGEIFAFLGANGSGKTTTIRTILNIYKEDSGEVKVFGQEFSADISKKIGYLPEERGLYLNMTVLETLVYFAELKGLTRKDAITESKKFLRLVELETKEKSQIKSLSSGQQQKIQLGVSLIHNPELLILDEPTKGLDPVNRRLLMDIIEEKNKKGVTVIFSTHIMEEAEKIADRILILHKGKASEYGDINEIKAKYAEGKVFVETQDKIKEDKNYKILKVKNGYNLTLKNNSKPEDILQDLVRDNVKITMFKIILPTLEEIFIKITK